MSPFLQSLAMTILVPSAGPSCWKQFLAKPELHWAAGFSARTLAYAWEDAKGYPPEVAALLDKAYGTTELVFAVPEHKTPLPGGRRESQSDVFAIGSHATGLVACTIEGKVDEPFGPTVAEQMQNASPGRIERLAYLCGKLGLESCPPDVHYQLLHRTVSALVEADRFHAADAAMIVHSFSPKFRWFEAFARFADVLGCAVKPGWPAVVDVPGTRKLVIGWATGDQRFRAM